MAHRKRRREDDTQSALIASRANDNSFYLYNHPPEFWDSLKQVSLTSGALQEHQRRTRVSQSKNRAFEPDRSKFLRSRGPLTHAALQEFEPEIVRFARLGGPDLSDLRGFPAPKMIPVQGTSKSFLARESGFTSQLMAAEDALGTNRSSAYDADFERILIESSVYPVHHDYGDVTPYPEPSNLSEIRAAMAAHQASLSPSPITEQQFRNFLIMNNSKSEGKIMRTVIPMITGFPKIPNEGQLHFTNLTSMTKETTVKPIPDFWDGARAEDLHQTIREHADLSQKIIPTRHVDAPVVPNFFLEVKALAGSVDVVRRQAMAVGAYGARGMHSLQNHGLAEPVYDGNAYTYSSTYHSGILKLYSHHLSAPTAVGDEPKYHMTQLRGYDMTDSRDSWLEATAALRNIRDLAQNQRNRHIQAANARATQADRIHGDVVKPEVPQLYNPSFQSSGCPTFDYLSTQDQAEEP